jgi:hypothetical protein
MGKFGIEELRRRVIGKSDEAICAFVASAGGPDVLLDRVFAGMQAAFDPTRAGTQPAVSQYDVDTEEGIKRYQVKVVEGNCTVVKGTPEKPRVTLALSLPNFLRLVTGALNGMQAFMSGQVKVSGDVMLANAMLNWFVQP